MKRGQLFSMDLFIALFIIVVGVGMIVQGFDYYYQQTSSAVESAKMQQIALDAAALRYYSKLDSGTASFNNLDTSAATIGYQIGTTALAGSTACTTSVRGTPANPIKVYVCRGTL